MKALANTQSCYYSVVLPCASRKQYPTEVTLRQVILTVIAKIHRLENYSKVRCEVLQYVLGRSRSSGGEESLFYYYNKQQLLVVWSLPPDYDNASNTV